MTKPSVRVEEQDELLALTLDRPERRNALDVVMLTELLAAVRRANGRPVLLQASGPAFTAGADLSVVRHITDPAERRRIFGPHAGRIAGLIGEVVSELLSPSLVSVVAINGPVVGGGIVLAMACDFKVASTEARFWFPEVELGREAGEASVRLLTHLSNPTVAKELFMLGRRFDASELLAHGLLGRVVSPETLASEAQSLCGRLARLDPTILTGLKRKIQAISTTEVLSSSWRD